MSATIHVAGPIGKVIFIPANQSESKTAILNVGVCSKAYRKGGVKTLWYQACWTGEKAERLHRVMNKVVGIAVTGTEDFKIKHLPDKLLIDRTIWVDNETIFWKEKAQLEMDFS